MAFTLRGPSGRICVVGDGDSLFTVGCTSPAEAAGQWIIHSSSVICAIRNGKTLERLGDTLVFTSALDEAGEEFVAVLERHRLCIVRLQLSTPKLSLPNYYQYLRRYFELFGPVPSGVMSVAGDNATNERARLCIESEQSFRMVELAYGVLRACQEARRDIARHPRGRMGAAGVDALLTLKAWRENPHWYVRTDRGDANGIACGAGVYVVPRRALPRESVGGNLFTASMAFRLGEALARLPRTSGGLLATSLLHAAKACMETADQCADVNASLVRLVLGRVDLLPQRSSLAVRRLLDAEQAMQQPWEVSPAQEGQSPYMLPETEIVFQRVAITILLVSLGVSKEVCSDALHDACTSVGLRIEDRIRAWYDTASHGLGGWRRSSALPANYRPDLVLRRNDDDAWMLVDAKLRHGTGDQPLLSQSAIKDIQAYMQEYGLRKAVILAPSLDGENWTTADLTAEDYHIRAIGVPSSGTAFWNLDPLSNILEGMWNQ